MSRPAVFLDRDGVINDLAFDPVDGRAESPLTPDDVRLMPGAAPAIRAFADAGWPVVVVSNQPAAAKGKVPVATLDAVHERVVALLAGEGAHVDGWRYCRHRREDACVCRKPQPGLLLDAAAALDLDLGRSWMIGDTAADVRAGQAVGARTVLIEHPGSGHKRDGSGAPDVVAPSLAAATEQILIALNGQPSP